MSKRYHNPRAFVIDGHPTSMRLEPEFWQYLREIAAETKTTAVHIIREVKKAKNPDVTLSSAVRVFIAAYFRDH